MVVSPGSQKSGRNKEVTFAFFAAANYLSGPLGKQNFTYTGSKGHGL